MSCKTYAHQFTAGHVATLHVCVCVFVCVFFAHPASVPVNTFAPGTVEEEEDGEDKEVTDEEAEFEEVDIEVSQDPQREESREADDGFLRDNHIMKVRIVCCVLCIVRMCGSKLSFFRSRAPEASSCRRAKKF